MNKRNGILLTLIIIVGVVLAVFFRNDLRAILFQPTPTNLPEVTEAPQQQERSVEVVADSLQVPWALAFLPEGDMLVTERSGTLRRIGTDGQTYDIEGVEHSGEGGLLGVVLHPSFAENRWLYVYLTSDSGDGLINRVERYTYSDDELNDRIVIIDDIPGASYHDGGRLAFGPDEKLYITTGDAGDSSNAQDRESLAGKILRLNDDGTVPETNPFGTPVYSYGHRNPQGLAWDSQDRLWSTEHGRSGVRSGFDELNLIEAGANYGWPTIQGDETADDMREPIVHSGSDETWAPAGLAYASGSLYFGGLRGQSLYEAKIEDGDTVSVRSHYREEFGRLRDVAHGPEGSLFVTTSNRDGRGQPASDDDRILKVDPDSL